MPVTPETAGSRRTRPDCMDPDCMELTPRAGSPIPHQDRPAAPAREATLRTGLMGNEGSTAGMNDSAAACGVCHRFLCMRGHHWSP